MAPSHLEVQFAVGLTLIEIMQKKKTYPKGMLFLYEFYKKKKKKNTIEML